MLASVRLGSEVTHIFLLAPLLRIEFHCLTARELWKFVHVPRKGGMTDFGGQLAVLVVCWFDWQ